MSLVDELKDEQKVKRFAKFLHSQIPLREAVQLSKRVNYFRGKKLIAVLMDEKVKDKNKPVCQNEEEAKSVGLALLQMGLIHASEVVNKQKRELKPVNQVNVFSAEGYYTWIYEGSKTMRNVLLGLLVASITAMCMFPIWPQSAKVGIWYISVTLLIALFVLFVIRLMVYIIFWSIGYEFWILPNFFDEDLGVLDSFIPLYTFSKANDLNESWYFRAAGFVMLLAFGYWCSQQPTEFDELYAQQMDFLSELYEGKLLGNNEEEQLEQERREKATAIPDLEELKREMEDDDETLDSILAEEEEEEEEEMNDDDDEDEDDDDQTLDQDSIPSDNEDDDQTDTQESEDEEEMDI